MHMYRAHREMFILLRKDWPLRVAIVLTSSSRSCGSNPIAASSIVYLSSFTLSRNSRSSNLTAHRRPWPARSRSCNRPIIVHRVTSHTDETLRVARVCPIFDNANRNFRLKLRYNFNEICEFDIFLHLIFFCSINCLLSATLRSNSSRVCILILIVSFRDDYNFR